MSVMSRIRGNFRLVAILIFVAIAVFVLQSFWDNNGARGRNTQYAGNVGSEYIETGALEFERVLIEQRQQTPIGSDANSQNRLRADAWNSAVQNALLKGQWDDLGMKVSPSELGFLFTGPYMASSVSSERFFKDSLGQNVDTNKIRNYLRIAGAPDTKSQEQVNIANFMSMKKIEVTRERLTRRLIAMINGGVYISSNEAKVQDRDDHKTVDFSVFGVPYKSIADDQIKPTDADFKKYYDKHREEFRSYAPGATIKYAVFSRLPSAADSADAEKDAASFKSSLIGNPDALEFARGITDMPFDTNYQSVDAMFGLDVDALIAAAGKDTAIGPYAVNGNFCVYKVTGSKPLDAPLYRVSHIQVPVGGPTKEDTAKARAAANALRARVNKDNWAQMVAENAMPGMPPQNADGDLGWLNNINRPEIYNAAKAAGVGSFFVVSDREGVHVCWVRGMSDKKYQVAQVAKKVVLSDSTDQSVYAYANNFLRELSERKSIDSAARVVRDVMIKTSGKLDPSSFELEGVGNGRKAIAWALRSEMNAFTEGVLECEDAYVVAQVISKFDKGYKELDAVKEEIRPEVIKMVKAEKLKAKIQGLSGDFAAKAAAFGPGAMNVPVMAQTFNNDMVNGVGNEPLVVGIAFGLKPGETSPIIEGNEGLYIVKVEKVNDAPPAAAEAIKASQTAIAGKRRQDFVSKVYLGALEVADVNDTRYENERE